MTTQLEALRGHLGGRSPRPHRGGGRVLLVGGGRGGVGTSTIASLLGIMAAADGSSVLLVDADSALGALPFLLGVQLGHGLGSLRGGAVEPEALLVPVGETLTLLPVGAPLAAEDPLAPAERRALFRRVASLYARFDLVVVDAGSRLDSVLAAAGAGADQLLVVAAPEKIAVAAGYALIKAAHARFPALPVDVLVNRASPAAGLTSFREIGEAAELFLQRVPAFAGSVTEDESLRAGVAAGMPVQEAAVGSPAAAQCHEIAARLVRELNEGTPAVVAPRKSHWR